MKLADIFISYARVDQPVVKQLSQALEIEGFTVWWDRELLGGDNFADDIERELTSAKAVIVSWSESGSKSRWVRDEAAIAADAGTLIAISADGSGPPIGFRQFHCIDFSSWQGREDSVAYTDLLRAVTARITKTPHETAHVRDMSRQTGHEERRGRVVAAGKPAGIIVAALPFANRSPLAEDAFFADGVHDELLTQISKLSAIQVISRTSVMGYRDMAKSIREIARELGASVILEGAVQRASTRVRINVQLIDGRTDTHIWAEKYDREMTPENIFDIQSEITREIVAALDTALSTADELVLSSKAPTNDLTAYDAYLRGKQKMRSEAAGESDFHAAIAEFDQAIAVDPDFAEPHANRARAYLAIYWFFGWDRQCVEMARLSVERANVLAPGAVESLLAQAYFHYWGELDLVRAEMVLNQVLEISPQNTEAWACKGYVIRRSGRFTESNAALRNAMHLDPMLIDISMELANSYAATGHFQQAAEMLERVHTLAPKANFTAIITADFFYCAGEADLAYAKANMDVNAPDFVYFYRRAFHALNTTDTRHIAVAINNWPAEFHATPMFPETYNLYNAMACLVRARTAEAQSILTDIKARIDRSANPYPGGWMPEAAYFPVTLPGLMGDIVGVCDAVNDFKAHDKGDHWGKLYHYHAIASAFSHCGDINNALAYLEKLKDIFGACSYLPISITPAYKILHNQPRYQALKTAYESSPLYSPQNLLSASMRISDRNCD